MVRTVNYSGLIIAGIGFFLTRFTVTLALYEDPVRFYFAGVIPLALGLGLAAFGVAVTVANIDAAIVRMMALWCVIGTATMFVFAAFTVLGSTAGESVTLTEALSQSHLSNFLIGGSIGGTFTGLYASRNRHQQHKLRKQSNRLIILNRMLRHEVLNGITAIQGHASLASSDSVSAEDVIKERCGAIEETINDVKYLTRQADYQDDISVPIDLEESLQASVEEVSDRYPDVDITVGDAPEVGLAVLADDQLTQVFSHLLENAIVHGDDLHPSVEITTQNSTVRVSISDTGHGLPASQQALLETGDIDEYDNPRTGFGLNLVRLFIEEYGGEIEVDANESGTTISVLLPRAIRTPDGFGPDMRDVTEIRPAIPHLLVSLGAALMAGVFYGMASEGLGGSVAGIGVFYGAADPVVGWITHEFHSVVFGFVYIGLISLTSQVRQTRVSTFLGVGIGWALLLWAGAAGIIAPIWLRLLGISASIPNISGVLFVSHMVWGVSLALLTVAGYRVVLPRVSRWLDLPSQHTQ